MNAVKIIVYFGFCILVGVAYMSLYLHMLHESKSEGTEKLVIRAMCCTFALITLFIGVGILSLLGI